MATMTLDQIARLYCVDAASLSLPDKRPSWITAELDRILREQALQKRVVQLPSFYGAKAIGIFSDYSGDDPNSKVHTYSFLFADFGALGTFDERVKEIRRQCGIPARREIKFEQLRSSAMTRALPLILRAADEIPGLLFSLVVDKRVSSIIGAGTEGETDLKAQLASFGFNSWQGRGQSERLVRILHSVCYWLGVLGRANMKTLWMTDNDSILGRSDHADEFSKVYAGALALFNAPKFEIIGTAKSFVVEEVQPYVHELVSVADLVAGAWAAYFTDRGGGSLHAKKHPQIGEILTFLRHQAVFLKKLTVAVQPSTAGLPSCGLVSVDRTTCSTEGYTAVEFE